MTADTSAEFVQALADDFEKLADLIARIEAAQGPDRVLDWQIYAAGKGISWGATEQAWVRDNGARGVPPGVPAYTASLDAAASLFDVLPDEIPSCPRKCSAAALRAREAGNG